MAVMHAKTYINGSYKNKQVKKTNDPTVSKLKVAFSTIMTS